MTLDKAVHPSSSSNHSSCQQFLIENCIREHASLISVAFYATLNLLLLPLYLLVLFFGFKQWQQQQKQGVLSGTGTSDILTYNLVLVEIVGCLSSVCFVGSSWTISHSTLAASFCTFAIYFFGEALFYCGICVDRYLAVVHPITYRNLKEAKAVVFRNITIIVCWLCFASWIPWVLKVYPSFLAKELLVSTVFFTVVVLYCCFTALYVLTRPGPNGKKQIDQSKLRAFHIISAITCLLFIKMIGILMYLCFYILCPLKPGKLCMVLVIEITLITPINSFIPLLYLRRMKQTFS